MNLNTNPDNLPPRARRILARAITKHRLKHASALGGIMNKARLIVDGKGKNGRSMSPALLARHVTLR